MIGFGIVSQLIGLGVTSFSSTVTYAGFVLTLGAAGVYIWAVLKYNDYVEEPLMTTAFRAWRINFISFWVAIGVAVINIGLGYYHYTLSTSVGALVSSAVASTASATAAVASIVASVLGGTTAATTTAATTTTSTGGINVLRQFGALIGAIVGAVAIGVGIYFSWFIKNLWYLLDAGGSLASQPFDYTKWTDRVKNPKSILAEKALLLENVHAVMF